MIDSNSRIGSVPSSSIGTLRPDIENIPGQHFHEWLQRHQLWLPATFPQHHTGESHTWVHTTGASARLDYVALPLEVDKSTVVSWISDDIDVSLKRVDHLPACLELSMSFTTCATRPHSASKRFRSKHEAPQALCIPPVPWAMDVHHHADCIERAIRDYQLQCNSRQAKPRKQHLSTNTWNLILEKKKCWKQLRSLHRSQRTGIMREVFQRWKLGRNVSSWDDAPSYTSASVDGH